MASIAALRNSLLDHFGSEIIQKYSEQHRELTIEVPQNAIVEICCSLRDHEAAHFEQLIDLCGVDYSTYSAEDEAKSWTGKRYSVVYHLLSVRHNHRLRVKTFIENDDNPIIASVTDVWPCADWFEREAFDLFGIVFEGHPDLRRILTDYGFVGHPFRKDFPLSGYVEMRYDPEKGRVVYEPVTVEPRTLVPRVIREDSFGHRSS